MQSDILCSFLCVYLHRRQAYASSDGGDHPTYTAASKLKLTPEQVSRGLLYRQHVLGLLDR